MILRPMRRGLVVGPLEALVSSPPRGSRTRLGVLARLGEPTVAPGRSHATRKTSSRRSRPPPGRHTVFNPVFKLEERVRESVIGRLGATRAVSRH